MPRGDLQFDIVARDKASRVFGEVGESSERTGKKLGAMSGKAVALGTAVGGIAGNLLTALPAQVLSVGTALFDHGAQLEAMANKAKTVFGDELAVVDRWAKDNASKMGLTTRTADGLAASFADLLIPMGFTRAQAAKMSTETLGLAGALSQWTGGQRSAADVAGILSDAMLGETDGLKGLGISISAADVQARLAANGQDKLTGAALQQAKALATQQLILEKSTDAQKAYADGGAPMLTAQNKIKAAFGEMYDKLTVALQPALVAFAQWMATDGVEKLQQFVHWLSENRDEAAHFGASVLDMAAAGARGLALLVEAGYQSVAGLVSAAGWLGRIAGAAGLSWGDSLASAAEKFQGFHDGTVAGLNAVADKTEQWADKLREVPDKSVDLQVTGADVSMARVGGVAASMAALHDKTVKVTVLLDAPKGSAMPSYGPLSSGYVGARAAGGPVRAGSSYLVGEKGPETFVPSQSGVIVPHSDGGSLITDRPAGGSGAGDVHVHVDLSGAVVTDAASVDRLARMVAGPVLTELRRKRGRGDDLGLA